MNKNERPLDYFLRMLIEKKLNFSDLTNIYTKHLEAKDSENNEKIVEASVLVSIMEKPTLWQGTKTELKNKINKFLAETGVFNRRK